MEFRILKLLYILELFFLRYGVVGVFIYFFFCYWLGFLWWENRGVKFISFLVFLVLLGSKVKGLYSRIRFERVGVRVLVFVRLLRILNYL